MSKKRSRNNNSGDGGKKFRSSQSGSGGSGRRGGGGGPKEIVFDPEARRAYLQGFSERKRQRRAYGLAMQKVKDRKEKMESRRDRNQALKEQVEEAEKQKLELVNSLMDQPDECQPPAPPPAPPQQQQENDEDDPTNEDSNLKSTVIQAYQDGLTRDQWGGHVIVTTSTEIPGDDDDSNNEPLRKKAKKQRSKDTEQEYAGKVEKYLEEFKSHMPPKKKRHNSHSDNHGRHGAANMKGMASAATGDLKIAQKALARSKAASGNPKKRKSRK